jgi:hypothetical protein
VNGTGVVSQSVGSRAAVSVAGLATCELPPRRGPRPEDPGDDEDGDGRDRLWLWRRLPVVSELKLYLASVHGT